ncbi:hypothetical protein PR048_016977 [Dryococelus australis]|uniref:Uncharacterized protein n=1 Tax=Dryococelus australis TaxID=614101 RepID=A0ABQ9H8A1_9NEOP|nr:hypothetical protein PR048_016977 [Dryococelus australis]
MFEVNSSAGQVFTPKVNLDPPHYDGIQCLAIQDTILFSGSRDMCIKKWDLSRQELIQMARVEEKVVTPWPFYGSHEYPLTTTRLNCEAAVFPVLQVGTSLCSGNSATVKWDCQTVICSKTAKLLPLERSATD